MYLRDLQSQIQFLRHDLPAGYANQALQDAARWVARKTGVALARTYSFIPSGTYDVDLLAFMSATTNDFTVLRPKRVMHLAGMPVGSACLGVIDALTASIPNAGSGNIKNFYVSSVARSIQDAALTTYTLAPGDVLLSDGRSWIYKSFSTYSVAKDLAKNRLYRVESSPLGVVGAMSAFVTNMTGIELRPKLDRDTPVMIECSIVPNKEFDDILLPVEAEDAIIARAKYLIFSTPNKTGGGADKASADRWRMLADNEMTLVRSLGAGGYGETMMAPPPIFGV